LCIAISFSGRSVVLIDMAWLSERYSGFPWIPDACIETYRFIEKLENITS
jgi:hypothetical protein